MWKDEFLKWNPLDYDNITVLPMPKDMIWSPDITVYELYANIIMKSFSLFISELIKCKRFRIIMLLHGYTLMVM
jgi:hypothetical protein